MEMFEYSPLTQERDGSDMIRLIELHPGYHSDQITISLTSTLFQTAPDYEALSYCWGTSDVKERILVNNKYFKATQNLHAALVRMRQQTGTRRLWVDAICINQKDVIEKSKQVNMMRNIYEKSQRTLVWLGQSMDDSTHGLALIPRLMDVKRRFPDVPPGHFVDPNSWSHIDLPLPPPGDSQWIALRKIFDRPWFKRVWIVQEVAISKTATIFCGDHEGDFDELAGSVLWAENAGIAGNFSLAFSSVLHIWTIREMHRSGKPPPLAFLLSMFRESLATDPRDNVFAFLGVCKEGDFGIKPDYKLSVAEVFTQVARAWINTTGTLDCLKWCQTGGVYQFAQSSYFKDLPSWVPDWTAMERVSDPLDIVSVYRPDHKMFSAAGTSLCRTSNLSSSRTLAVEGSVFDTIIKFGDLFQKNRYLTFPTLEGWEAIAQNQKVVEPKDFKAYFYRTLLANTFYVYERVISEDLEVFPQLVQHLEALSLSGGTADHAINNPDHWKLWDALVRACEGRVIALTSEGHIALVPELSEEGDSICLLRGGSVPFVMREVGGRMGIVVAATDPDVEGSNPEVVWIPRPWELKGGCYVHGLMSGSAFIDERCVRMDII